MFLAALRSARLGLRITVADVCRPADEPEGAEDSHDGMKLRLGRDWAVALSCPAPVEAML
jgi:hypothetical protein